jgi:uncharacterized protein YjbI with pentapeptide repeats
VFNGAQNGFGEFGMRDEVVTSEMTAGNRWGDAVSPQREQELDARLQAWQQSGHMGTDGQIGPFASQDNDSLAGGRLSGADVYYLATCALTAELGDRQAAAAWLLGDSSQPHPPLQRFLSALHLEGADLSGAQLQRAVLLDAHIEGGNLTGANLQEAALDGAHLEGACLADADLRWADCVGTNFKGADLSRANLEDALLTNARLAGATMDGTLLEDAILDQSPLDRVRSSRAANAEPKRRSIWMPWRVRV